MQARTRDSSVSSQALYHRATAPPPLCCLKKMQCNTVMRDKIVYTGLLVFSFAACFLCLFFFFVFFFFTANYVDPASSGSSFEPCHKIAAINVAFLHE